MSTRYVSDQGDEDHDNNHDMLCGVTLIYAPVMPGGIMIMIMTSHVVKLPYLPKSGLEGS